MSQGRPIDQVTRAAVLRLLRGGLGKRAIARVLRLAYNTVDAISRQAVDK
jgi:DNA-binding NarL/FixJ family response regulator